MKYIDAEKLIAELRRQKRELELSIQSQGDYGQSCHIVAYDNIISLITSLQQEQPDFPTTDEQMKEFLATHPKIKVPEKYKNPDWLLKKQEQLEVDLEKEIDDFLDNIEGVPRMWHSDEQIEWAKDIARHFYELALNARKEE